MEETRERNCSFATWSTTNFTLDCISAPLMQCGKKLNEILIVAIVVAENAKESVVAPMVESSGVCIRQQSVFFWCVWQESGFSLREYFYIKLFHKEML
jgi:hypothetical protein